MKPRVTRSGDPPKLVALMLQEMPPEGAIWSKEARALWLKTLANIIDLLYGEVP